ncbi:predicted protein [Plenodomus lingam JN3]|uniref:Uncharacterized protein n=1 Tax=Leptosphaeria maculans (strain JN3 / isolate v23.1.3 / race Av1-4-5-6-7-8) TaxID=985895 RepID=E5A7F5_LEPMJ|nr:predicted protein [Plenodomus lingam JN3]CBX99550.1 predicted protein [Plenodomus lingam JN3]
MAGCRFLWRKRNCEISFDFQGCGTRVATSLKGGWLPLKFLNRAQRSLRLPLHLAEVRQTNGVRACGLYGRGVGNVAFGYDGCCVGRK